MTLPWWFSSLNSLLGGGEGGRFAYYTFSSRVICIGASVYRLCVLFVKLPVEVIYLRILPHPQAEVFEVYIVGIWQRIEVMERGLG